MAGNPEMKKELIAILKKHQHTMVGYEGIADEILEMMKNHNLKKIQELNKKDMELRSNKMFCEIIPKSNIESHH